MRLAAILVAMLLPGPATPATAQERWALVEDLRIGADDGPASFADVRGLAVDRQGRIFVFDYASQDLRIFDPSGRYLRTSGRRGAGPGEYRNANGLLRAPDGTLWLSDRANARFTVLDAEGEVRTSHSVPILFYGYRWGAFFDDTGRLHDPIVVPSGDGQARPMLRRFRPDMSGVDTLPVIECPAAGRAGPRPDPYVITSDRGRAMLGVPFLPTVHTAPDAAGAVWCGVSSDYRVVRLRVDPRDTLTIVQGSARPLPVTAEDRRRSLAPYRERFPGYAFDESRIPRTRPIFEALHTDDENRLWIRLTTPGDSTRFEVWSPGGRLVARVSTALHFEQHQPFVIQGGRAYGVVLDEDEVPHVVRARLER